MEVLPLKKQDVHAGISHYPTILQRRGKVQLEVAFPQASPLQHSLVP